MTPKQILDHPVVAARCLFPRRARLQDPFVVLNGGVALHCYRSATHDQGPWLLHFHGNGEIASDWLPGFTPGLVDAGLNVVLGEYRGYGGSSGSPALASMLDDALAITDALGVDPGALVVYGRSLGSIYALHVSAHRPVAGVVIESGIADAREHLALRLRAEELGVDDARLHAAIDALMDHRAKVQAFAGPMLVLHAQGDVIVGPEHGAQLAQWAGPRATLRMFERGNHNTIHAFNGAQIIELVARFVHEETGR